MSCVHEDICDLEISMNDVLFSEVGQSLEYVFDDGGCLGLVEITILSESGLKISFATELGDDIAVSIAGEYLEALENIGMAQFFENINFRKQQLLQFFAFERL